MSERSKSMAHQSELANIWAAINLRDARQDSFLPDPLRSSLSVIPTFDAIVSDPDCRHAEQNTFKPRPYELTQNILDIAASVV